ncbi:MAG: organic solvent transporter substrate-binding protein [Solirubrobacterales bacterium]|nr:organic solvent transporter substrate-binding protein [Solirubrobacterales bacterium]
MRSTSSALIATAAFAAVVTTAVWIAQAAQSGLPWKGYYTLQVHMRDLAGLTAHSEVRLAGTRVGQVLRPRIEAGQPTVDLQLNSSVGPLPADTRFAVRSKGLLGGRFLEIDQGHSVASLHDGAMVAASRSSATVQIPELLNSLDRPQQRGARDIINNTGAGLFGRGLGLNDTVADGPKVFADLGSVSSAVLSHTGSAQALVPALNAAVGAANPAREDVASGFQPQATALRPFADRATSVRAILDAAPSTLQTARDGLAHTDPLLVQAGGFARAARRLLKPAPVALRNARQLLVDAPPRLKATDDLLTRVKPAVSSVLELRAPLQRELPRVDSTLKAISPLAVDLSDQRCDIAGWATNWSSMLGYGVPGGGKIGPLNVLRLQLVLSPSSSFQGVSSTRGIVKKPYPTPCAAGARR